MKILFISSRFPYPLTQGDRLRAYHFLRLLSKNHQITLVVPIQTDEEHQALQIIKPFCHRIEAIPVSKFSRAFNLIRAPFRSLPWQVTYYQDWQIEYKVKQLLSQETFDVIHTQLARMAPITQAWSKTPKVLDFIDALSLNMSRRALQERGILAWLFASEAKRMQQYERELINYYHKTTICSEVDRKVIGEFANLQVVPNGVDLSNFPFASSLRPPYTVIFTGNMNYFPNINAVQYFIDEVLPRIRLVIPQIEFIVVGPHLSTDLQKQFLQSGCVVTGFVPSVHEYLQKATVAVAPMQAGSGIQNKVLEAMSTGTPVVATPYGVGSLPVESGKHLLIAKDAEEFAQAVIRLMHDHTLRQQIINYARQLVEAEFTWEHAVSVLEDVYQQAIQQFNGAVRSL